MTRPHRFALMLLLVLAARDLPGQTTAVWSNGSGGAFGDPGNWTPQNVPGDEPGVEESARFDLPGSRTVALPADGVLTPHTLESLNGETAFETIAGATATLDIRQTLSVGADGRIVIGDGVRLTAATTSVGSPLIGNLTEIQFEPGSSGNLGAVTVGANDAVAGDSLLTIFTDGVEIGQLQIRPGVADGHTASVQVSGGQLTQLPDAGIVVGDDAGSGSAILTAAAGGVIRTGAAGVAVHRNGRIANVGGEIHFDGDVTFDGGPDSYSENPLLNAQRSFAAGSRIEVLGDSRLQFGSSPVLLDEGQTLMVDADAGLITAAGNIVFGPASSLELAFDALASSGEAPLQAGGQVTLAGSLEVSLSGGETPPPGFELPLITAAGGFLGDPPSLLAPAIPGIVWELQTTEDTLSLLAVEGLAGDYNGDGLVDAADYTVWRDTLGSQDDLAADGDASGAIDAGDYAVWQAAFGSPQPQTAAVPEPATPIALMMAALLIDRPRSARVRRRNNVAAGVGAI